MTPSEQRRAIRKAEAEMDKLIAPLRKADPTLTRDDAIYIALKQAERNKLRDEAHAENPYLCDAECGHKGEGGG